VSIYHTDEMTFEMPDGYQDRTMNTFASRSGELVLNLTRDDLEEGGSIASKVNKALKVASEWPRFMIIDQRDRTVAGLRGRETRLQWMRDKVLLYQHQVYLPYYSTLLTFTGSAPKRLAGQIDAHLERALKDVKFRKQAS
jgi:hypothetical protein